MIPTSGLADYITGLARQHGVTYERTSNDALAEVITRLSDDNVKIDPVVLLLLPLECAGVIPSGNVVPLHVNYLREKLNGRLGGTNDHAECEEQGAAGSSRVFARTAKRLRYAILHTCESNQRFAPLSKCCHIFITIRSRPARSAVHRKVGKVAEISPRGVPGLDQ